VFQAPGEAEAELAYLNSIGEIDAVLSDDSDTFLFGASVVIRKYVHLCADSDRPFSPLNLVPPTPFPATEDIPF
jgi:5'-3' exonuclease